MVHPGVLMSRNGEALMQGDFDRMARAYCFPFVVSMDGHQHVIRCADEVATILGVFREDMLARGVVTARSDVISQIIVNDMAYLIARITYHDGAGRQLTESRCSYVMRLAEQRWQIITVSIDKKAAHSPGACLLDAEAA